jgi:hypothetical protein
MITDINLQKLGEYSIKDAILKVKEGVAQRLRLFYCARDIARGVFGGTFLASQGTA